MLVMDFEKQVKYVVFLVIFPVAIIFILERENDLKRMRFYYLISVVMVYLIRYLGRKIR